MDEKPAYLFSNPLNNLCLQRASLKFNIMRKIYYVIVLVFLLAPVMGWGQIYTNAFAGTGACPTQGNTPVVATNATGAAMLRSTLTCNSTGNVFNSTTLNATGSLSLTSYIEFSVTANAGYKLNLTSLSFFRQGSNTAPNLLDVRYSTDGFVTNTAWGAVPNTTTGGGILTWDFTDFSVSNPTTITFRFYPYGTQRCDLTAPAAVSTGTFRVDDVTLNGTVSSTSTLSVPSSGAGSLAAFGNVCKNTTAGSNSFTITGTSLTSANVTVAAATGYTYSTTAGGTYTSTLNLTQSGGSYSQNIFVKFLPTATGSYGGPITVSGGGATTAVDVVPIGEGVNNSPTLSSGSVSAINTSSATISANITDVGCNPITADYGIEWSTTAGFANGTGTAIISTNLSGGTFSVPFTGGTAGQTYYFHTFANNDVIANRGYGAENSFTLLALTPTLSVPAMGAGSLASFGAVCISTSATNTFNLTGSVLDGSNITIGASAGYTYSTTLNGTYSSTLILSTAGTDYSYTAGTLLGCTIFVKFSPIIVQAYNTAIPISGGGAAAINIAISGNSGVNIAPTVTTGAALFIGTTTATLPGNITNEGCGTLTVYGIEYSTTINFVLGSGTQVTGSNLSGGFFSVDLSALALGQTYYYRAYAQNAGGVTYGGEQNFITYTLPTKLVITSVFPASPTTGSPFSLTVQALDGSNNPVDVITDTDIQLALVAGGGSFILPNDPSPIAGVISAGNSSITISGLSYDLTGVAKFTAAVIAGMTLTTSAEFEVAFVPYSGPATFIWNLDGGSRWTAAANWFTNKIPGVTGNVLNNEFAIYQLPDGSGHGGSVLNTGLGGVGINMNDWTGEQMSVGGIYFNETYNYAGFNNIVSIGNSSGSQSGNIYLWGVNIINVGDIVGNNFTNLMLANYMTHATTKTLQLQNKIGSNTTKSLTFNIAASGSIVAGVGRTININTLLAGATANTLTFAGGGNFSLKPLDVNDVQISNTFSGPIVVANGTLTVNNTGAFNNNLITLGAGSNPGKLVLNGNSVSIRGLSISGTKGVLNIVENNNATTATITINNSVGYTFAGAFNDGAAGILNITKTGSSALSLTAQNNYTGSTTVSAGTLQLNSTGGTTIPIANDVTISGGILRISSNQTVRNINISSGTLQVDAGVTLTITGTYTVSGSYFLNNLGTINLNGSALQTFPGAVASITNNVNLRVSNIVAVTLNRALGVSGTLLITSTAGTLSDGGFLLNGTGGLTMQGGILQLNNNGNTLPGLAGTYTLTAGTVTFNGTGVGVNAQTIRAVNYFNLTSSLAGDRILAASGTIGVSNIFTPGTNTYTTTGSTIDFNKSGITQNIPAFTYNKIRFSNGGTKQLAGDITVVDNLKVATTTTFELAARNCVLKSDASKTAMVDVVDGTISYSGAGIFEVQRFFPAARKWRLVTAPLNNTSIPTISTAWQDGQVATTIPPPAYTLNSGVLITLSTTATNGFDKGSTANPSLKYWDFAAAPAAWKAPANTNVLKVNNDPGYMLFVRGDRNFIITDQFASPTITTLRPKGRINTGTQTFTSTGAGFRVVGNPFASAIDFKQVTKSGLSDIFYLWDPKLSSQGAFVSFTRSGGSYIVSGGSLIVGDGTIQSGAAFMVNYTGAGSVGIPESSKITGSSNILFGRPTPALLKLIRVNLSSVSNGVTTPTDGVVVSYNKEDNNAVDGNDAVKFTNIAENISLVADGKLLSIEKRKSISFNDTIFFKMYQMRLRNYSLDFITEHIAENNLSGFIEDIYLNTKTPLNMKGITKVDFAVTADTSSYAANRFRIVFKKAVRFGIIKATNNANDIIIDWKVAGELNINHYEIERSADGINFSAVINTSSKGNNTGVNNYSGLDENPAPGIYFYRIKGISNNGAIGYSENVKVVVLNVKDSLYVYPNPVTNGSIGLQMNSTPAGVYSLRLLNSAGQSIVTKTVNHAGGTASVNIQYPAQLTGHYQLEITGANKKKTVLKVVIQ